MPDRPVQFETSILFVDDDPLTREHLGELLRDRCRQVNLAADGKEGLRLYRKLRPDIVITDVLMPVLNGIEMVNHIRSIDPAAKIVIISAYSDVFPAQDSGEILNQRILLKPVDLNELFMIVANWTMKKNPAFHASSEEKAALTLDPRP